MATKSFMQNPQLDGEDFFWKGSPTGILLIHGFTATTTEVRLAAEQLHEIGYTVTGPLLPGHGTTPEDLNHVTWQMWMEKVKQFYEDLLRECEQIFVVAESMGSLLALELAVQHPEIKGLCLFSPAIKAPRLWLTRFLQPFVDHLNKNAADDGLPWKGYNVYPVRGAVEMLKLQKRVRRDLDKVTQPTLVFTGEYDRSISPDAAEIVMKGLGSEYKEHIHMSESPHCILLDSELDQAVEEIDAFIHRNLGD